MNFDDATRAQIRAARPDYSTWLGANAGSGKTRVLTDRVARLLLDGVDPQHILCLTYTKAAASEMQNRLFQRLGGWAMLPDDDLSGAMAELGVDWDLDGNQLRQARRLFALAIETPGGLKIQTIHSFCAALLRRFPLEAEVSPQFTEIEDRAAELLRAEIVDDMATSPEAQLVAEVARHYSGEDFGKLTAAIVSKRESFAPERDIGDFLVMLGQPRDLSEQVVLDRAFNGTELTLLQQLLPHLFDRGANDAKAAAKLAGITALNLDSLAEFEQVFLFGKKAEKPFQAKVDTFPTKATRAAAPHLIPDLNAFMERVEDARQPRLALLAAQRASVLHDFARAFLQRYGAQKAIRGWLDFDDLILKTRALLQDSDDAAWVRYRMDGTIEHILVDEAQDTSPEQWDVIEALASEFHSGEGARDNTARTLFVVGDKKQSIYSFQGADPLEFDRKSADFEAKFKAADKPFQQRSLDFSFRSSAAVLRFVDTVFDPRRQPGFGAVNEHIPFKKALPGRVDIWPAIAKDEKEKPPHWTDPVDRLSPEDPSVQLARKIAEEIKRLTDPDNPGFIPDDGPQKGTVIKRPIRPGDFLILVQRRSHLFTEIIRACKKLRLPIAGADRLKVGAELAVKDLRALLAFLASADDDLALATALKSPLFGWGEQALFDLAHRRGNQHLWEALRKRASDFPDTFEMLRDLRDEVDFLRPFDLLERILTRHDGRRNLLSRLGAEAEDGINEMLTQALSYERNAVPSLTGFIQWLQTDDVEIKRQVDSASNQIRVMTVHGSKGLEAPIVILPDTGKRTVEIKDDVILSGGVPFWKPAAPDFPQQLSDTIEERKEAERAERLRLFYVAMTRAEKWLIVAVQGELSNDGSDWYQTATAAMAHLNPAKLSDGTLRLEMGPWDTLEVRDDPQVDTPAPNLEPVFSNTPPIFCHPAETLSPSDLGGQKALPGAIGEETEAVMAYGTLVHELLEALPGLSHREQARTIARLVSAADEDTAARAVAEARAVLDNPDLAAIFAPGTLAEVPVTGSIGGQRLHGVIDRLCIEDDRVVVIDYKTNSQVPQTPNECPDGILRQMGAYAALLSDIYPDKRVETCVLWTASAQLMTLPHDIVTSALQGSPYLDAAGGRS